LYMPVDILWASALQHTVFGIYCVPNEAVESVWKEQRALGRVNHVLRFIPKPYYTANNGSDLSCLSLSRTSCVQPLIFHHPETQTRR
jgi:hypothetical protein